MRARSLLGFVLTTAFAVVVPSTPTALADEPARGSESDRARARELFTRGQAAYADGHFSEAARLMREAYTLTENAELAFNVARVYERMSEYEDAIRFYRIYLRRGAPSDDERADVERRIAAIQEAQARRRAQVFTAPPSEDALTAEARTFFLRGVAMYRRGHYEAAMQAFTAAYRFAPLPEVIYNLAVTAERLGSRRDAIDYYREYLRARRDAPDRGEIERKIRELRGE